LWRDVEHIARGDEQRRLLENVAPAVLDTVKAEDTKGARRTLANHVSEHVERLRADLGLDAPPPVSEAEALEIVNALDEGFARHVETMGEAGGKLARKVRAESKKRTGADVETRWKPWAKADGKPRWLLELARVTWLHEAKREADARPFAPTVVRANGDRWAKQPKVIAPVSWAMGAPGMRAIKLDGENYAPEPGVAVKLVPRSFALLAGIDGHERRPHQTVLALESEEDQTALAVAVVGATNYAISPLAAKLALLVLASEDVRSGKLQRSTLEQLAQNSHPGARIQPRELHATAAALDDLRRLFVYLPNGTKIQTFDTTSAASPGFAVKDLVVKLGLARTFLDALASGVHGGTLRGNEYNGDFLVNLDAAMRLPGKRPALLRHYIRAAAHWNASFKPGGAFDEGKLPAYTAEKWGAMTNSLPPGVVEYLDAGGKRTSSTQRAAFSKSRKSMLEDLEYLHENGLVRFEKSGRDRFRLLPPDAYQVAWTLARKAGARPDRE